MNTLQRSCLLLVAACMPLALPAAPSAQQDFVDAVSKQPDAARGEQLFATCARCHGADGRGDAANVPRIAGQHPRVIIRQLVDYRYDRRSDPLMEKVADGHQLENAQDVADVAAWAASLVPGAAPSRGRGDFLQQGQQAYAARCAACHGPSGAGSDITLAPRLAGQHYAYLLRQLHDALEGRRPRMGETHDGVLRDLDRDALQGISDMLSRSR